MLAMFAIISLATFVVYIDKLLDKPEPLLGEEWDFVTPNNRRSH